MKRMKNLTLLFGLLSFLLLSFCKKTDVSFFTTYPEEYNQKRHDKFETTIFVKTNEGFEKIDPQGTFLNYDTESFSSVDVIFKEVIYFNKVIFNSDSKAQIKNDIENNSYNGIEVLAKYTITDTNLDLTIAPDSIYQQTLSLFLDFENQEIKTVCHTFKYSYKNTTGIQRYSAYKSDFYTSDDVNQTVKMVIQENNLVVGDTIAVLTSNIVFTKQ
jgi:hypothetical protein